MPVKEKQQKVITTERKQAARWVQHFEEVLNRPDLEEPAEPPSFPPGSAEVRLAIENMKNRKVPTTEVHSLTWQEKQTISDVPNLKKVGHLHMGTGYE